MKRNLLIGLCIFGLEARESTIPVVDMREFYSEETRSLFVEKVKDALHEFGFFAVINTGIDPKIIDNAFARTEEFFLLAPTTKKKYDGGSTNYQRGYASIGKEEAKGANTADYKEFLHFGREFTNEQLERTNLYKNKWPEEVCMKDDMLDYLYHLETYMVEMQHVLALALDEEEDFFDKKTNEGDCLLRAIHYPKIKSQSDKRAIWAAEHTDIDLFTILPKATEDGLEVLLPSGNWHPVHVTNDAFIINGGDFLEIFSNGYFKSSKHRVLAPLNNPEVERYSMVFFVHPSSDTMLYPLPQWSIEGEKYAHATRLEMLMERLADLGLASDSGLELLGKSGTMERLIAVNRASISAMRSLRAKGYASKDVLDYLTHNNN